MPCPYWPSSFSLTFLGGIFSLAFRLSNLFLGRGDDVLHGEAEMFLKILQRRGGSEAAHADAVARHADVARPSECRGHLDGDAGLHPGWQYGIPVGLILFFEQLPRRHADDARLDSLFRKPLERVHAKVDFA